MKKRILSLLLTLVMVLSLIPTTVWAAGETVHVIVENTTFTKAQGAPWDGTLVDEWVEINEESTMMSCVGDALAKNNIPAEGIDNGYITTINGLSNQGGKQSGWMGTLNDWFTNEGFGAYTVAAGTLSAGDEIRVMYTCAWGADLGSDWSSTDKTLKELSFSVGTLSPAFHKDTHSYTLTVPADTDSVVVTPTASNKNYQVRTYVGETEYKRTAAVPVADDTEITVKCGDPSWPSMNTNTGEAQVYTVTVKAESGAVPQGSLASLIFRKSNSTSAAAYPMTPDFAIGTKEYTLSVPDADGPSMYVFPTLTEDAAGKSINAAWTNRLTGAQESKPVTGKSLSLTNSAVSGVTGNTVTLTIGDNEDAYTVKVVRTPTLKSLSLADDGGSSVALDPAFSPNVTAYRAVTTSDKVTLAAEGYDAGYTVTYNGNTSGEIKLHEGVNPVTVKVTNPNPANGRETVYTVTVTRTKAVTVTFTTTPPDAVVMVQDGANAVISPDATGKYTLLGGVAYTYTVTRYGYVAVHKEFTPTADATIPVTLTAAPTSSLTDVGAAWKNFRNSDVNMAITSARTPKAPETTALKWAKQLGFGYTAAPSVPIIVDNSLIVMSGKTLYKLDLTTRTSTKTGEMASSAGYGTIPPTYAKGMIFCPLNGGIIQAFDAKTLESLWVYRDPGKGQALSPITYSDGYIYTGFWNSETKSDSYVCLSVTDEDPNETTETKYATWTKSVPGGFYWAGSVVVGDVLVVGTDDGASGASGTSRLYALNKKNGSEISHLDLAGMGDQRSSIAYSGGRVYFTTKGGYLCSAAISNGRLSDLKWKKVSDQSTSTPIVYNDYVYFCAGSGVIEGASGSGYFVVADAKTLEKVGAVEMKGYPQCSPLLSTAYEDEGYLYFYCTYNANPGGISLIKVKTADKSAERVELYTPEAGLQNYCITSIICGTDGTLYYKNDSGNVFAVGVSTDAQKAQQVQDQIDAIGKVALDSENAIKAARTAYDALTDAQKELVNNLSVLTDAETKLAQLKKEKTDQDAADAVIVKIQAVETAVASGDKAAIRQAIRAARTAYNSLTSAQKKLVTNYSVLTEAEKAYPGTSNSTKPGSTGGSSTPADSTVKSSDTGDSSQMMLWMGGVLLSAAALTVLTRKRKRS